MTTEHDFGRNDTREATTEAASSVVVPYDFKTETAALFAIFGACAAEIVAGIVRALEEDIGSGDATTDRIVPRNATMSGQIIAKQDGIIAGLDVAQHVLHCLDKNIIFTALVPEGAAVTNRQVLAKLSGSARALLSGERTALNYLGRMSGIATLTRRYVDAVGECRAVILDTRKTAPGLRAVDKLAVKRGGGQNHRIGLYDMILIKDNHIDFAGSLSEAVRRARESGMTTTSKATLAADSSGTLPAPMLQIEVEARTLQDVQEALNLNVERILLDNMTPAMMRQAVEMRGIHGSNAKLEASGNVTLSTIQEVAETGVDFISIGALTHSVLNFDVSLDWTNT